MGIRRRALHSWKSKWCRQHRLYTGESCPLQADRLLKATDRHARARFPRAAPVTGKYETAAVHCCRSGQSWGIKKETSQVNRGYARQHRSSYRLCTQVHHFCRVRSSFRCQSRRTRRPLQNQPWPSSISRCFASKA